MKPRGASQLGVRRARGLVAANFVRQGVGMFAAEAHVAAQALRAMAMVMAVDKREDSAVYQSAMARISELISAFAKVTPKRH